MPDFRYRQPFKSHWPHRFLGTIFLSGQVVVHILKGKIHRRNLLEQMMLVGPGSLMPVVPISFFAGMIFTIQTARTLNNYGALNLLGGAFSLAFCRELAPLLTAGLITGHIGSAFAAEIGEMRVTDQIDAMYMLQTDPVDYLVTPRVIACCTLLPILTIFAVVTGLAGGVFAASHFYNISPSIFLESARIFLKPWDLVMVIGDSLIFGLIISVTGCSWGLTTRGGAKGVSQSTTAAVVNGWIFIFFVYFCLSIISV
jgi:phospholipid/cholesterol/gamma-HCH transport system permease protein